MFLKLSQVCEMIRIVKPSGFFFHYLTYFLVTLPLSALTFDTAVIVSQACFATETMTQLFRADFKAEELHDFSATVAIFSAG